MAWTPKLGLSLGRQRTDLNTATPKVEEKDFLRAEASLNLFKGGGDFNALHAASHQQAAEQLKILDEELKLEVKASELIFQHLSLLDVIRSAEVLLNLREESHRIVFEKYKQGKSPLQEVTKSEIDRTQQENRLRTLRIQQLENQAQLKALLLIDLKTKAWPFSLNQKIRSVQENHTPKVNSLLKLSQSSEELWKASRATYWPSLDLSAGFEQYPLLSGPNQQWTLGLVLNLPIWSRYETAAKVAAVSADRQLADQQADEALRIETAQREVLQQRINLSQQNLVAAQGNLEKSGGL